MKNFSFLLTAATVTLILSSSLFLSQRSNEDDRKIQTTKSNTTSINATSEQCTCHPAPAVTFGLNGDVPDCCCSFRTLERTNFETVYPLLRRVVSTPFFAHFKVDLCSECELWSDAPMCMLRDCGVCECERPPVWADAVEWLPERAAVADNDDCGHVDDEVLTTVNSHISESWETSSSAPYFLDERRILEGSENENTAVVVDLRLNPERYTGYSGASADRVWAAVHGENCFQQDEQQCALPTEQRVYNRIISGMHSSISLHIAHSYCLEMDTEHIAECKTWGANATLAQDRVLSHKDRLENLYVAFAVMLRAVQMAGLEIGAAVPTNDPFFASSLDEWTNHLHPEILKMVESCPPTFDERSLFLETTPGDAATKRLELNRRFRHLLDIMKCVGCDRCKLWGTLQTLGVGTALRIIIDGEPKPGSLSRQEAVALVHTLERFSSALVYIHEMQII